jgi:hypothetical protein
VSGAERDSLVEAVLYAVDGWWAARARREAAVAGSTDWQVAHGMCFAFDSLVLHLTRRRSARCSRSGP